MVFKRKTNKAVPRRRPGEPDNSGRSSIYSYHSARSKKEVNAKRTNVESTNAQNKPKTGWLRHIPTLIGLLVVCGSILYAFSLGTDPKVRVIDQTNQSIIQPISVYQDAAQKILSSSTMNQTKLSINSDQIANQLQKQFPELNGVSLIVPLLDHTPVLEIRPSQSVILLANSQGKFVVNQLGNAVLLINPTNAGDFNLPVVTDQSGLVAKLGKPVLTTSEISFINTVIEQFKAKGVAIQSMTLSTTPYELDVRVGGQPYYIKFSLLADALYSTGTYFAVDNKFNASNPLPTQYIDIRIPGRAYYK